MPDNRRYIDRAEYLKLAVSKRRKEIRKRLIEYKGGQCSICAYNKCQDSLDFHHLDPTKKDFGISSGGLTRSWEKVKRETDKCILVCANCHRELHSNIDKVQPN